jgi:hypothetical protein
LEAGCGAAAEGLHRVHRTCGCAAAGEWREDAMVEGAAGVQDDFAAGFFGQGRPADFREFLRHVFEHVIWN